MKVIDAFLFSDELALLECRLRELDAVVDRFVLVESNQTFQGTPKPLWYAEHRERFAPWNDRIEHVIVPELPDGGGTWAREWVNRECMWMGLGFMERDDLFMMSDVDEIPSPKFIEFAKATDFAKLKDPCLVAQQRMFAFAVDWEHPDPWPATTALPAHCVHSLVQLRLLRDQLPLVDKAGWHLSWLKDTVENKLHSFSHSDLIENIERVGLDRFYREGYHVDGKKLKPVTVDDTWPRWIADKQCPPEWFRP